MCSFRNRAVSWSAAGLSSSNSIVLCTEYLSIKCCNPPQSSPSFAVRSNLRLLVVSCGIGVVIASTTLVLQSHLSYSLPRFSKYYQQAYTKVHKLSHAATLAYALIHTPSDSPRTQALVLALEAAFSCLFWAIRSADRYYGFGHLIA
jgi:hypothetical protein